MRLFFKVILLFFSSVAPALTDINDFSFKSKIKGKIGTFSFKEKKVSQELNIYKISENKFIKF